LNQSVKTQSIKNNQTSINQYIIKYINQVKNNPQIIDIYTGIKKQYFIQYVNQSIYYSIDIPISQSQEIDNA